MITFTVPIRTVSGLNVREHWTARARRVKAEREAVAWALIEARLPKPEFPCAVTLTRVAPRALDEGDNLSSATKGVRDQIAHWLEVDDRDPRVTWHYGQRKGAPKSYSVEVQIA